jgi:hypothetical protein
MTLEQLLQPVPFVQCMASAMLAILFLQSGLDKVFDFKGNLAWLTGHFAKSPLRGAVLPMLVSVTVTETAAGALAAAGTLHLVVHGIHSLALWGARLATLNIVMLFLGQRLAKDYAGAASLVPYFVLCAGALLVLGMPMA